MEPGSSIPNSQELSTCPYPEQCYYEEKTAQNYCMGLMKWKPLEMKVCFILCNERAQH
jgi:hypothetical protein